MARLGRVPYHLKKDVLTHTTGRSSPGHRLDRAGGHCPQPETDLRFLAHPQKRIATIGATAYIDASE